MTKPSPRNIIPNPNLIGELGFFPLLVKEFHNNENGIGSSIIKPALILFVSAAFIQT